MKILAAFPAPGNSLKSHSLGSGLPEMSSHSLSAVPYLTLHPFS